VDGLGAVAVWVEEKSSVVVVAIFRPRPRLAVAPIAGVDPDPPELVDVVA
jgi:hypothetical protein